MKTSIYTTANKINDVKLEIINYFALKSKGYCEITCKVSIDNDICKVNLSKMYEGIQDKVNFEDLTWLSKLLNTTKINMGDRYYSSGCDTCDYGSRDELTITCLDIKI